MNKLFLFFFVIWNIRLCLGSEEDHDEEFLKFYPFNDGYLGKINSEKNDVVQEDILYQTIIVMDRSGSMGPAVERLVQNVFPMSFNDLSYKPDNMIHLITFGTQSQLHKVKVEDLLQLKTIKAGGGTLMKSAIDICQEVFGSLDNKQPVRLLTVSDGEIQDQPQTAAAAADLNIFLNKFDPSFKINSKAMRLITSDNNQPDTTAISSLLLLNNVPSESILIDIASNRSDDYIVENIVDLFKSDNFGSLVDFSAEEKVIKYFPFDDFGSSSLQIPPNNCSYIYVDKIPENGFTSKGLQIIPKLEPELNADTIEEFTRNIFDEMVSKLKLLKIVDSEENRETINKIRGFFLDALDKIPAEKRTNSNMAVFNEIEKVVKDQKVKTMSQQEKSDWVQKKIDLTQITISNAPFEKSTTFQYVSISTEAVTEPSTIEPPGVFTVIYDSVKGFLASIYRFIFIWS